MLAMIHPDAAVSDDEGEIAARYLAVAGRLGPEQYKVLRFGVAKLSSRLRKVAHRSADHQSIAGAADRWLGRLMGPPNDLLRRATVAMLAVGLSLDSMAMPQSLRDGYLALHADLSRSLTETHTYEVSRYVRDLMLATGILVPAGSFLVKNPYAHSVWAKPSLARASAGFIARQILERGVDPVREGLAEVGIAYWAEIQFDDSRSCNPTSVHQSYRLLANLLQSRPDLAGVRGTSWLYDPHLSRISPSIACARQIAEDGGASLIRLPPGAEQAALAVALSSSGRRLFEAGDYKPVFYSLCWGRQALLAWEAEQAVHSQLAGRVPGANRSEEAAR